MNESQLRASIRESELRIEGCRVEIKQLEQKIDDLIDVRNGLSSYKGVMANQVDSGLAKLNSITAMSCLARSASTYAASMSKALHGSSYSGAQQSLDSAIAKVDKAIQSCEAEIEQYRRTMASCCNQIDASRRELTRLQAED